MKNLTKLLLISLGVIVVYAAGQTVMNRWTPWSTETKASVWVAVGTVALAVATFWSVWETRLVIRGEDRRHQQSFAPFLVLRDHPNQKEDYKLGHTLYNKGTGIALDVSVKLRGSVAIATYELPPGAPRAQAVLSNEDPQAALDRYKVRRWQDIEDSYTCSSSYPGGSDTFEQRVLADPMGVVDGITYSFCEISYFDVFGNPYMTRYSGRWLDAYDWVQPAGLQIPN